jgi:hypothetical protein
MANDTVRSGPDDYVHMLMLENDRLKRECQLWQVRVRACGAYGDEQDSSRNNDELVKVLTERLRNVADVGQAELRLRIDRLQRELVERNLTIERLSRVGGQTNVYDRQPVVADRLERHTIRDTLENSGDNALHGKHQVWQTDDASDDDDEHETSHIPGVETDHRADYSSAGDNTPPGRKRGRKSQSATSQQLAVATAPAANDVALVPGQTPKQQSDARRQRWLELRSLGAKYCCTQCEYATNADGVCACTHRSSHVQAICARTCVSTPANGRMRVINVQSGSPTWPALIRISAPP